jgi:hypothetical protein
MHLSLSRATPPTQCACVRKTPLLRAREMFLPLNEKLKIAGLVSSVSVPRRFVSG